MQATATKSVTCQRKDELHMYTNDKVEVLRLRVSKDLKNQFQAICEQKCLNGSAVIRQLLEQWIAQQQPSEKGALK